MDKDTKTLLIFVALVCFMILIWALFWAQWEATERQFQLDCIAAGWTPEFSDAIAPTLLCKPITESNL